MSVSDSAERPGPLAGYRVLEIGSTVAGPFCGRMLADFGAEVIKIEPPEGDPVRTMGKQLDGHSLYAASIFRNKRLIALDLHRPEGQAIARDLAATCDVLVENFKPGTLEAWGLGWAELSKLNPRLVMVRTGSPSAGSILITSAPKSASMRPQNGPATVDPISSTRYPLSGPAGLLLSFSDTCC